MSNWLETSSLARREARKAEALRRAAEVRDRQPALWFIAIDPDLDIVIQPVRFLEDLQPLGRAKVSESVPMLVHVDDLGRWVGATGLTMGHINIQKCEQVAAAWRARMQPVEGAAE